jgi:hypothetical protein
VSGRPCIVCGACAQLKEGVTPEVVVVGAVLHGMAAGAIPGARPSLCPAHDLVRAILCSTVERIGEGTDRSLAS